MLTRFGVDYASRQVNCHGCKNKVDKDQLRMIRRFKQPSTSYFHPGCLFTSFERARAGTDIIQNLSDIEGLASLSEVDQRIVSQLVADWKHRQLRRPDMGQASSSGVQPLTGTGSAGAGTAETVVTALNGATSAPRRNQKAVRVQQVVSAPVSLDNKKDDNDDRGSQRKSPRLDSSLASDQRQRDSGKDEDCSVCLDPIVHPVSLPCGHLFCFLCAKGLVRTAGMSAPLCSLCRRPFPANYLDSAEVLASAGRGVAHTPTSQATSAERWQWFYQGKAGWWQFEERNSTELEDSFANGQQCLEMLICGTLYVVDFVSMEQYQKNYPTKRRRIKRDVKSADCRGVAGIHGRGPAARH